MSRSGAGGRPTFAQTREHYLGMVRRLGDSFTEPDDDWAAVIFLETPRGRDIVAIEPGHFATDEGKERYAREILPSFISEQRASRVGLVVSSWFTSFALPVGVNIEIPPSLAKPGRREVVTLQRSQTVHIRSCGWR
jgi:hypothetical protein